MDPDRLIGALDNALRTLFAPAEAGRPSPARERPDATLADWERRRSIALLRVDHAGEVCAQGLYQGQLLGARDGDMRRMLDRAAREERDHLAWTEERLQELGAGTSLLNPVWYAASFTLGAVAGAVGDALSLGFLEETERQVEAHLAGHLEQLPEGDARSRAVVEQMRADEAGHAVSARDHGAVRLPRPVRSAMRAGARLMTGTAGWI